MLQCTLAGVAAAFFKQHRSCRVSECTAQLLTVLPRAWVASFARHSPAKPAPPLFPPSPRPRPRPSPATALPPQCYQDHCPVTRTSMNCAFHRAKARHCSRAPSSPLQKHTLSAPTHAVIDCRDGQHAHCRNNHRHAAWAPNSMPRAPASLGQPGSQALASRQTAAAVLLPPRSGRARAGWLAPPPLGHAA